MRGGKLYMKFGLVGMNNIIEKIVAGELSYKDNIIIGDNSSGKTLLIKLFIERAINHYPVYFIDAVNRGFDVKKVSKADKKIKYNEKILKTRLEEKYFNLEDSFNCLGTSTERVEMFYQLYEKEVQNLFYELTGDKFSIIYGEPLGMVDFGNGTGLLSSGYQAIIRILFELIYYQDTEIEKNHREYSWVVIDELDEFLSPKYSARIFEFLKKKFPWGRWLITTHSCDLVAYAMDANMIILEDCNCEVIDINDYQSLSEVQIIFDRVFKKPVQGESQPETILRRLLNNKINRAWGKEDEICLDQLSRQKLTASQQMILRQIKEW